MTRKACVFFGAALWLGHVAAGRAELTVRSDFEGGSARVVNIDQATKTIRFMPAGDPARGWPCWWYFRVDGIEEGATLTFEVVASDRVVLQEGTNRGKPLSVAWSSPVRAAVSHDGKQWEQTAPSEKRSDGMTWKVPAKGKSMLLAWGPPFTPTLGKEFIESLAKQHNFAKPFTLAKTREGRDVPAVWIRSGSKPDQKRLGVWVQARQHAWETGASWVCRGLTEWLAGEDDDAKWLRENGDVFIVPVMDVDHVATGDGGKEALPQDHNRDWSDKPHWPEVAAAQARLAKLASEGRLDFYVDLHNPAPSNLESFFFSGEPSLWKPKASANLGRFAGIAAENLGKAKIPYDLKPRPNGTNYHPMWRQMSGNWVRVHGNEHTVALCLETSWNTPASNIDGYRDTGARLGKSIAGLLRQNPRTGGQ